jgi:hypothetical protein
MIGLEDITKILDLATKKFIDNDKFLLSVEANERSLTHKFAEYLQPLVGMYSVDCEYNRNGDGNDPKEIGEINFVLGSDGTTTTSDTEAKTVYPDIIIHERGEGGKNLLVIEAKKNSTPEQEKRDKDKLDQIQQKYGYRFSVFLKFFVGNGKESIEWVLHNEKVLTETNAYTGSGLIFKN